MPFSKSVRLTLIVCAALWMAVPLLAAPLDRGSPLQGVSPLDSPPPTPVVDLFPTPVPDSAACTAAGPCAEGTSTPAASFQSFLPGVSESGNTQQSKPPSAPPDLGTLLNYLAVGVVVIGVTLKVVWFVADRRKAR